MKVWTYIAEEANASRKKFTIVRTRKFLGRSKWSVKQGMHHSFPLAGIGSSDNHVRKRITIRRIKYHKLYILKEGRLECISDRIGDLYQLKHGVMVNV